MDQKDHGLRFRVDARPVDIGTYVELHSNGGMVFDTRERRDAFFREANPTRISYGAALSHARATNLGIWGNGEALYQDCAGIMAIELQRRQIERREKPTISAEEVMRSRVFREAYDKAREPTEAALHNLVRALGSNADRLEHRPVHYGQQILSGLHDAVLQELQSTKRRREF